MSNTITVKLTSSNKQNNALLDAVNDIFRTSAIMNIAPLLRFTKVDGVATPTLDKVLIDGITWVSLRNAITFTIDTKLSVPDTYIITGYGTGRDGVTLDLIKKG